MTSRHVKISTNGRVLKGINFFGPETTNREKAIAICVVFLSGVCASNSLRADLIARYRFDEPSGTTAIDSVGSQNGIFINSPTRVPGIDGGAIQLDDADTDYVEINSVFGLTNNATLTSWVNLPSANEGGVFIKIGDGAPGNNGYTIGVGGTDYIDGGNKIIMVAEHKAWMNTNVNMGFGSWTHIAMTVSPHPSGATYQAWLNGSPAGPAFNRGLFNPTTVSGIGGYDNHRVANVTLDDVQIYNEPLTSTQIAFLAANPGVAIPEPSGFACCGLLAVVWMVFRIMKKK